MKRPLISIIVPSYNQGRFLAETIESIIDQNAGDEVEILVLDGGSKDESVDVIRRYEKHLVFWKSEKDNGQSAAINEGFRRANGEFVTWLNSDDVYLPGALNAVIKCIRKNPGCSFFMGNVVWMDKEGKILQAKMVENSNDFWTRRHLFSNGGPSAFMRKSMLDEVGLLREDFNYMMDTELWHRIVAGGNMIKRINSYVWGLRLHEDAKMSGHNFAGSALADKEHPSWKKKRQEKDFVEKTYYRYSPLLLNVWKVLSHLNGPLWSIITDKRLRGKYFKEINKS